jgi:hypothetical protein
MWRAKSPAYFLRRVYHSVVCVRKQGDFAISGQPEGFMRNIHVGKQTNHRRAGLLVAGLTVAGLHLTAGAAHAQTWAPTLNSMSTARDAHTMLRVNNQVLVIGGRVNSNGTTTARTDSYDLSSGQFSTTGSMASSRSFFPAVLLDNGRVLAAGGFQLSFSYATIRSSELFNPSTRKWSRTGSMNVARELHSGTKLPDGRVLMAGGFSNNLILNSAEIYNPASGTFTWTASMNQARFGHTATPLSQGVFVTGGRAADNVSLQSTEFYSPLTGWSYGPSMRQDRYRHTSTVLKDGRILVTGGYSSTQGIMVATMEIYDPNTNVFTLILNPNNVDPFTGEAQPLLMSATRMDHSATLLPDGRVLIVGGWSSPVDGSSHSTTASADIFDPTNNTVTSVDLPAASRHEHATMLLPNGTVLLTGGLRVEPALSVYQTLRDSYIFRP